MFTHKIKRFFSLFLRDCHGGMALFIGMGLFTLVTATGIAVDMSRIHTVRAKLSNALDSAGLAAGTKAHSSDVSAVVNNYMNVNFPASFLDSTLKEVTATVNADRTVINLSATASVDMTFMKVFGQDSVDIHVSSEITRENRGLELVMVLDVTGSMYGSKISDLRTAATDMTNILFGQKDTMQNLWVAIVPYVTTVNIGPDKISWLKNYDLNQYTAKYPKTATKWKGCVEARNQWPENNGLDVSDAIPDPEKPETLFNMYFWKSASDNTWINNDGSVSLNESAGYGNTEAKGPNVGCGNQVTPFTSKKSVVQSAVDALTPWRRGGTMSSVGLAWGWRMVSPKWRGMWGHEDPSLPLDYNTPLMSKAVIVMTDGVNEVYTPYSTPPYGSDYTGYRRIGEKKLGSTVDTRAEGVTAVNSRFASLCSSMKQQGILIYTVTFQLNDSTTSNNARTLFRNCASHPDFYFDSPDGATLRQAFKQIGDSLANLMISR